jgi:hypothetical protein
VNEEVVFRVKAEATALEPGASSNVKAGCEWELYGSPHGYPGKLPYKISIKNPDPATGGRDPPGVPPVVFEEPKEGESAVVVAEEEMVDPVACYSQWLLTHEDPNYRRFSALRLGELGDERALEALVQAKKDPVLDVGLAVQSSFKRITGTSIDRWLKNEEQKRKERERFRQIALQDARVVNVSIRDSVLQRSTISLQEGGDLSVDIKDSVVVRSDIGATRETIPPGETRDAPGNGFKKYEAALAQALADGVITPAEERLLKHLRKRFGISEEEHDILLAIFKTEEKK